MKNFTNKYFDISKPVFIPAAVITFIFVTLTIVYNQQAEKIFSGFQAYMSEQFGLFINISINYYLFFVLFLALSKFGKIKIGGAHAKPSFNKFSWIAMLFSAGMGIGLVYFSVAEPMLNFNNPIQPDLSSAGKSNFAMIRYCFSLFYL
jgi:choline/glycine/proline betaine transport protein